MTVERLQSGLYVKRDPEPKPTQHELMQQYYPMHCCCPECGSDEICTTTAGYIFKDIETACDRNAAVCDCGWRGIAHDLVPKTEPINELVRKAWHEHYHSYDGLQDCPKCDSGGECDCGADDANEALEQLAAIARNRGGSDG